MSKSSSSSSNTTIPPSSADTSLMDGLEGLEGLEGLKDINTHVFVGVENMRRIVKSQFDKLQKGDTEQQYLVFTRVSVDDLAEIDRARNKIGKGIRMTRYTDTNLLIVKVPTAEHESAHGNLANKILTAAARMGILDGELHFVGGTRYHVRGSAKEADSAYRPRSILPNKTDWPTIVWESGVSEPLSQLRLDAQWWLEKSRGAVKIVIIIAINRPARTLQLEKMGARSKHKTAISQTAPKRPR